MSKQTTETPDDAHKRLVLCGCGYWSELEMESASNGWVTFLAVCEDCHRTLRLEVSAQGGTP